VLDPIGSPHTADRRPSAPQRAPTAAARRLRGPGYIESVARSTGARRSTRPCRSFWSSPSASCHLC